MNNKPKILILGARGNLGSQLAKFLGDEYSLFLWGRNEVDAFDLVRLEEQVKKHAPDIIINCIAYNAVDLCEEDENEYDKALKLNQALVGKLADLALELDSLFIHFVSDYVFDGEKEAGYIEDDETKAISRYGETKLLGEREILNRQKDNFKFYLVRTSKLFGPRGESEKSKESFFDLILRLSEKQKEFKMVNGAEISCFTYTVDLAQAVLDLIRSEKEYGIYHIVNDGRASWYDGAKFLFELKNAKDINLVPVTPSDYPRPAKRPRCSVLVNTKLPKLRTWQEALREYLEN